MTSLTSRHFISSCSFGALQLGKQWDGLTPTIKGKPTNAHVHCCWDMWQTGDEVITMETGKYQQCGTRVTHTKSRHDWESRLWIVVSSQGAEVILLSRRLFRLHNVQVTVKEAAVTLSPNHIRTTSGAPCRISKKKKKTGTEGGDFRKPQHQWVAFLEAQARACLLKLLHMILLKSPDFKSVPRPCPGAFTSREKHGRRELLLQCFATVTMQTAHRPAPEVSRAKVKSRRLGGWGCGLWGGVGSKLNATEGLDMLCYWLCNWCLRKRRPSTLSSAWSLEF